SSNDHACSNLGIGQTICLGTIGEDCSNTYTVVPNDTCSTVMNMPGTNATILYANNPQINSDFTNIYVGEVLCTLNEVRVPPAPANKPTSPIVPSPGTTTAAPAPTQTPADLPWCDDPNDDSE
ncbi:hypothetical protein JB92DRAFT_2757317, partial [Gautieria morchelliformis]